jgi:hypothetical protein
MLATQKGPGRVTRRACLAGALALIIAMVVQAAPVVRLSFKEGRVWLTASDATAAQILAEWSRVGGTQVVNADRIAGPPLMLELNDVPEVEALEVVLRNAGGYIATARTGSLAGAPLPSSVARITILPASARPPMSSSAGAPAPEPPSVPQPAPILDASGAQRIIGPDGQPVPDDQEDAPPPPPPPPAENAPAR